MSEDIQSDSSDNIDIEDTEKAYMQDECLQPKNRFQERDPFSDITLVVEDQKLHVHKSLLMIHSPVFKIMLTGDFKEKNLSEIPLPGKKYTAMVSLLEQIYPGEGTLLLKDEILDDLLELAEEYDVQQVFINCRQYIDIRIGKKIILELFLAIEHAYDTQEYNKLKEYEEAELSEWTGPSWTDRILLYLKLVERFLQLHPLRQIVVEETSRISVSEMENSKYFDSIPATAMRDVLLQKAKNGNKRFWSTIHQPYFLERDL